MKSRGWVLLFSLLGIGFFLLFTQANAPSLDSDGIHYAAVAKEIARTNRWLLPFDPVVNKPHYFHFLLCIWPTALIFQWFGASPLTAKLYAMGMTLVAVGGIFVLGRILANVWVGWFAGLSFLLTNHVLKIARQCRPDLPLIAFVVLAFVGLVLAQGGGKLRHRWYLLVGFASLGAIMTKEVGGLVPLLSAAAYFVLLRKWRELFHPAFIGSWFLALGPVVAWVFLEYALYHDTLWGHYLRQSLLFSLHQTEDLVAPWSYYGWAILNKNGYLLPFVLAGGWVAWGKIRRLEEPRWGLILLWAAAFPLGFSLARHKIHYYILPMYAATALLIGLTFDRWIRESWRPRILIAVVGLTAAAAMALTYFPLPLHKTRYAPTIRLAPRIDAVVKKAPGEVIIVRQDVASLLFYSKQVTRVTPAYEMADFQDLLTKPAKGRRYCLIGRKDLALLDPAVQARWKPIIDDGDRLFTREESGL